MQPDVITVWTCGMHVARMGEKTNVNSHFVDTPLQERVVKRSTYIRVDNVKMLNKLNKVHIFLE